MTIETKYSYDINNIKVFCDPESTSWIRVGKFCSLGPDIRAYISGHDTQMLTTYPFLRHAEEFPNARSAHATKGDIVIGNDVWVGGETILMSGVTIGDGAVVAAGSVVCKDVPPYALAGGNPCRVIRLRFTEKQIAALLEISWWNWDHGRINEALPMLQSGDVERFIEKSH